MRTVTQGTELVSQLMDQAAKLGRWPHRDDLTRGSDITYTPILMAGGLRRMWRQAQALGMHPPIPTGPQGEGLYHEALAATELELRGHQVEWPKDVRSSFDFLVDGCVRVDVKTSVVGKHGHYQWRRLHQDACDLFMLVCLSSVDDSPRAWERVYFVPSTALKGQTKLSLSPRSKRFEPYRDGWEELRHLGLELVYQRDEVRAQYTLLPD